MGEAPAAFCIGIMAAGVKGQTALELCQWPGSMLTFLFAGEAYRALGERACAMRPEPKLYLPAFVPADFVDLSDWESQAADWGPGPGALEGPWSKRTAAHVRAVTMMVLDLDTGFDRAAADRLCARWVHFGHTSWSSTVETPKARLVFPLAAPVPVADWPAVWSAGARWAAAYGLETDKACKDPCRAYFLPLRAPGREAAFETWAGSGPGGCLEAAWLLRHYPAPAPPPVPSVRPVALPVSPYSKQAALPEEEVQRRKARAYLDKTAANLASAAPGGRNRQAFMAGLALGGRVALLEAADAGRYHRALVAAAIACGLPPKEAETAIANGIAKGLENPQETA